MPQRCGTPRQARRCCSASRDAAQAAQAAGLGVNAGHDLNRDNLTASCAPCRACSRSRSATRLIADALELGYAETVRAYLRRIDAARSSADRMIFGIGTDICDVRRIRAALERRGERFAERSSATPRSRSGSPQRALAGARPALPGDALLGQGGVLQGDRPGHAHADDLARLRDRQRAERQARDRAAWRRSPTGSRRGACAPTSPSPTKPTTRRASSSSNKE